MSISGALYSALTGISAASRGAAVVSDNIANASTPGYGPRQIELAARSVAQVGGGVQVVGITRDSDPRLTGERRLAEAETGSAQTRAQTWQRIEDMIGLPGTGLSLSDRIAALDEALIRAESRPDVSSRLTDVLQAASGLAQGLAQVSTGVQQLRAEADASIAEQVGRLNQTLQNIEKLNRQILAQRGTGDLSLSLFDQRQQAIDSIAEMVPLMEITRPDGQIALYTRGGTPLIDGRAATIGFTRTGIITPEMEPGLPLSGLTVNGRPIPTGPGTPMDGGTIAAAFATRDDWAPEAQRGLDVLARDLAQRFASPAADPTLPPGAPGLLTDLGAAVDPGDILGLSTRLQINPLVDPAQGGALWRLRDGIGAAAPGPEGRADGLTALRSALLAPQAGAAGDPIWASPSRDAAGRVADLLGMAANERINASTGASYAGARTAALREAEAAKGVDTDTELRRLLLIEQSFAANARVMQIASDMLRRLMEI